MSGSRAIVYIRPNVSGRSKHVRIGIYVDPENASLKRAANAFARWLRRRLRSFNYQTIVWTSSEAAKFNMLDARGAVLIEGVGGADVYDFISQWYCADSFKDKDGGAVVPGGSDYLLSVMNRIAGAVPAKQLYRYARNRETANA